ncbi:MAG: N-acetyltransferase [Alphaproteobacteria bacterium]|nr:N-acetyltransferase [Alphaproteobacteria bacterium]
MTDLIDDAARRRFTLAWGDDVIFADYARRGDVLAILHVETPPALRGKGAAAQLMQAIVAHARAADLKLEPVCSYAAAWFARHPDAADVRAQ